MPDGMRYLFTPEMLPVFLPFIVLVVVFFVFRSRAGEIKKHLEFQALKRNGEVKSRGFIFYPSLSIPQESGEILVFSMPGGKNSPPHTYVTSDIPSARNYKIKICREYKIFGVGTVFGQDIKINDPIFDEAFIIQGSDEMIVRGCATTSRQRIFSGSLGSAR